ncbi:DUF262 domain-containing protein [Pedobacter kyonggii]|uniref:DUF262 domain-containing protein n=1 Tax=Pedobacter kyonggii TaxID=1926871 RepID=A0A4Q9HGX3_9SPHI|nr:DUF262 domain-containing protein [Pedobacter kyonggii]TBO44532.1 DUF262 domain-containing protein [Pedobacter kyonggii]
MSYISTYPKKSSNILRLIFENDIIDFNPEYQRNGDIWSIEKRQLLIDSILNDYDIPKLYFHVLSFETKKRTGKEYAIIDGRQRIETIIQFVNGKFALAEDFKYLKDEKVNAGGFYYKDLAEIYPKLKMSFESFDLPITNVETDDLELIDDMFLRLNEAVPLNAAEKRNAIGGPLVKSIKKVASNDFFSDKIKFTNKRYQYLEVAVRLLFIEHFLKYESKVYDTKKVFLDALVEKYKIDTTIKVKDIEQNVLLILAKMSEIFADSDPLLRSQGIIPIYYLIFREIYISKKLRPVNRNSFLVFRDHVRKNKELAEKDIRLANYDLIDFDRMSVQGTNDAGSIKERLRIMTEFLSK